MKTKNKKKVTMISQGCRMNHAETATMINELQNNGYDEVKLTEKPDVVIINTCTVTENGDKDTIRLINKINRNTDNAKIALVGCQAQIKKETLMKNLNVKWVIGNEEKDKTVLKICKNEEGVHVTEFKQKPFFQEYTSFDPRHTRVNLKIQDGCNFYCSFCIIPFARGPARSREFNNIINDAKALIKLGVKEIILTGINLGTYENSNKSFYDVLETILKLNKNVHIRISSIEPTTIGFELIDLWNKYPNFCRYLHLPIQSGCDEILTKMRRKYTINEYNDFIQTIKNKLPDICIGTDIIVGFPGETDELFEKTKRYLLNSPINYYHVFSYSERSMAHARKFENKVELKKIKERSFELRTQSEQKWNNYLNEYINREKSVLFEQKKNDYWVGSTDNYLKVRCKSIENLKNKRLTLKLNSIKNNELYGDIIDQK